MAPPAAIDPPALRPSTVTPTTVSNPRRADNIPIDSTTVSGRGRGDGRGRGRGRGGVRGRGRGGNDSRGHENAAQSQETVVAGIPRRQFGGRLTAESEAQALPPGLSSLQADAPVFVPGLPHQARVATKHPSPRNHVKGKAGARRASIKKSQAQDIATRTHEDINNKAYECVICCDDITTHSEVWSCVKCWTVFHLGCIKKWAINEGSTLSQRPNQDDSMPPARQWRCPGCNLPKDSLPTTYFCWCGKDEAPRSISGIPPHSCGQTCARPRTLPKPCPHPCDLLCHAGPCPPCKQMGPVQSCFCGKKATSRRCVDTNYDSGWSCGEICGDLMPCGEHYCPRPCHEGLCGACETPVESRCYCGKSEQTLLCCNREEEKQSIRSDDPTRDPTVWSGAFECGNTCGRLFDCGLHKCQKQCHPQDLNTPPCPQSPALISSCPCGKTALDTLLTTPRASCQDPIPHCSQQCEKHLPCGHQCPRICHSDPCSPCLLTMEIACQCGRTKSTTLCHQGFEEPPQCMRTCRANLNCGRHLCGERCCTGERKAAERQATKRKLKPLGASRLLDEGVEPEHICTRVCGRMLTCGNHTCPELCHKGACHSCREAIFEEVSCSCGRTVLQPPLPCGSSTPACRFECERPKACGHPRVPHNCHKDSEQCPKCPFLREKICLCGKKTLRNQPCFVTEARCGEICGMKLRCGSHFCRQQCHRPGQCEDVGQPCHQVCGKARKSCGHPCEAPCHAPSSCKEDTPCQNKMLITCECQNIKQEVKCNASKNSEGNSKKSLSCDEECGRLARNQRLAQALNIDPDSHKDDHVPYSNETLKMYRDSSKWAQVQEREFRVFAADEDEKRLRFKPMPSSQRAFLHSLATDFGFDSESMDPEPHRHVCIFKTPRFLSPPMKTLGECVRIRITEAEAAVASAIQEQVSRFVAKNEPYNGFLLSSPRFGLTLDELHHEYSSAFTSTPGLAYDIAFLPQEEIVIKARPAATSTVISSASVEASLKSIKSSIGATTSSKKIAVSVQLCSLDASLNIIRREADEAASNDGWSRVAAKGAMPRTLRPYAGVGQKSQYTVLALNSKKKKEEAKKTLTVVDDWEDEMERQENLATDGNELMEEVPPAGDENADPAAGQTAER